MSNLTPMSDLAADDLLLDRLGARLDGGADPVADLLGALARQADGPLPARTARRRTTRNHRYLGVFMAIAVGASGAGVAAAVSLPHSAPARVERAHVIQPGEAPRPSRTQSANKAPDGVPGGPLSRLGLPVTMASAAAAGLVLVRRQDGTIVLVPGNAAAASAEELGAATGSSAAQPAADTHEDAKGASAENGEKGEGDQTAKAATSAKGGAPTKGTAAATGEKTGATAKAGATAKEPGSGKGSKATEGTNADPATSTRTPKTGTKTGTKTRARSGTKTRSTSGTKTGTVRPGTSGAPAAEVAPTP